MAAAWSQATLAARAAVATAVGVGSLVATVALVRAAWTQPLGGLWIWLAWLVGLGLGCYWGRNVRAAEGHRQARVATQLGRDGGTGRGLSADFALIDELLIPHVVVPPIPLPPAVHWQRADDVARARRPDV